MCFRNEDLICTNNFADFSDANPNTNFTIKAGTISFCKKSCSENSYGLHFFILVESDDNKTRVAFSYVPYSTNFYIKNYYDATDPYKKLLLDDHKNLGDDVPPSALDGYNPFIKTDAYIVDTWKLTDKFIRLCSKPIINWTFKRYPDYKFYNIMALIPLFSFTDCIGYSLYHYFKA